MQAPDRGLKWFSTGDDAPRPLADILMATIFDNIVVKENDHSNLLRNVMERDPKAAAVILTFLMGRTVTNEEAASLVFHTQRCFDGKNGREIPDLVAEGGGFRYVIEVKVDPNLELTSGQETGYLACITGELQTFVSLLVPGEWKHQAPKGVSVRSWRRLITVLEDYSAKLTDSILDEVIAFWQSTFQAAQMDERERQYLSEWSPVKYSAIGKLEKAVVQAKNLFVARGFDTAGYYTEEIESAFGFYLKRDGKYLLWVGIWADVPAPLSFGFDRKRGGWLRPARPDALPRSDFEVDHHQLWVVAHDAWDSPELIYERVNSFLDLCNWI